MLGAMLFSWLQGADFYRDLHRQAVETLPQGEGRQWVDMGCGPGLVTRLAAARGYVATGIDSEAQMVRAARLLGRWHQSTASFRQGALASLPAQAAEVVSAASLLAVLDDKEEGLQCLWRGVRPGGHLLIIEPTAKMTPENATALIQAGLPGRRQRGLTLWARARNQRALEPALFTPLRAVETRSMSLLGGLVGSWVFRKPA
jgi:trans-aconitate methyltransferase